MPREPIEKGLAVPMPDEFAALWRYL